MNIEYWDNRIEVACDRSTLKDLKGRFEFCNWIVEKAEWNVDNQRGEVILRVGTYDDQ